ncbi:hypothetical protein C1N91_15980 [Curtobacterium sp. SGAir0471]|uniref:DUF6197 family protein n=1 Tax=Curtobacterium sp. SGAir0471 TaxID=2070337 RepID=UPI0010CD52AE|nr:hypothetical protein [Curtobacterium sp. SGAir0471]QCR44813.1 hypothetical protein C1N91_15980 [Curtobacterium sp. SGAir0471]
MTLEFRVPHDVDTDASPAPSTRPGTVPSDTPRRTGLRGLLDRLAVRRAVARDRRLVAHLHELDDLQRLLTGARGVVERGWIQHSWFAYLDEHGRLRKASSAAALAAQGRPLVAACLVGAVVSAAGGPQVVHSQQVQRSLDLVWHALAADEGRPVLWCPAPDVRMARVRDLTTWNDRPGRTVAEVASLLLTAERVAVHEAERVAARRVPLAE